MAFAGVPVVSASSHAVAGLIQAQPSFVGLAPASKIARISPRSSSSDVNAKLRSRCFAHQPRRTFSCVAQSTAAATKPAHVDGPIGRDDYAEAPRFDYVIVGGGAAGCVMANRLSEDSSKSVLLIEAGAPKGNLYVELPIGFPLLFGGEFDWAYRCEPEPQLNGKQVYLPRGKLLGGSHAISVMLYQRGDRKDYEAWEAAGCEGWGPEGVFPYFKRSEGNARGDSEWHSSEGPLSVVDAQLNVTTRAFLESCKQLGLPKNPDFNEGWNQLGYGPFQVTQKRGRRATPATSYLEPIKDVRKNLTIITGAHVHRLVFEGRRCVGVQYSTNNTLRTVRSNEDVCLAAGSLATPQLLMLSGVGPAEHLREKNVPVVADLPGVGENLQDHPTVLLSWKTAAGPYTSKEPFNPKNWLDYLLLGQGNLRTSVCEAGGFFKSRPDLESADFQLRFVPFKSDYDDPYASFTDYARLADGSGPSLRKSKNVGPGFTMQAVAVRSESRGSVRLRSNDPFDRPVVKSGYLTHEGDMAALKAGVKLIRQLAAAAPMAPFKGEELWPGPESQSEADLEAYIKRSVHTANALVGTAKMGPASDPSAVVDPKTLKVHGIEGLRVVDSSLFPKIPGGQTGAPAMMTAEKAADIIKASVASRA
eukprot:tig00000113_g5640.t1